MSNDSSSTQETDGFQVLSGLDILQGIGQELATPDENIDYHVVNAFFKIRGFEYDSSKIDEDYTNDTCFYDGYLHRNFASAFLYNPRENLGLGLDWVARASITDYDLVWPRKQLLAGDDTSFRMKMFAAKYTDPDGKNEPYLFEGQNLYFRLGKYLCSELPLLNAIDAIANGLDLLSDDGVFAENSVFVVMTERIPCRSCRENIVTFLKNNSHIKKLKLYYMFDCRSPEFYEDASSLLSFFDGNGVDADVIRVKFIPGSERARYEQTPDRVRFAVPFGGYPRPDEHVYASLNKRTMKEGQIVSSKPQMKFDPYTTEAFLLNLDSNKDVAAQAVEFFENEYFANHKFDLFNAKDKKRKK